MSDIRFVAVPGGVVGTGAAASAVLRVLVVPRLDDAGLVADSALAAWPDQLAELDLTVMVRKVAGEQGQVVAHQRVSTAQPDAWERFFGRATGMRVRPVTLPAYPPATVAPTAQQAEKIEDGYANAAQKMAGPGGPSSPEAAAAVDATIGEFAEQPTPAPLPPPATSSEQPDLHRAVTMLREHPAVLQALGLILELRVAVADLDLAGGTAGQISVRCPSLPDLVVSPWTRYERSPGRFLPASTADVQAGMVDLSGAARLGDGSRDATTQWALTTIDVDGAVHRLSQAADNQDRRRRPGEVDALPTLRSAGLVLLRRDREQAFADRRRAASENAGRDVGEVVLDADALMLGYRIDVKLKGRPWRSLHRRRATYLVDGEPFLTDVEEENQIKAFGAVTTDGGQSLRADEVVARWSGWSLAVDPPDLAGGRAGRRRRAVVDYDFDWTYVVPATSLPVLQFGRTYNVRIRVADAAGGGLGLADPVADSGASDDITYLRHDPIGPPRLDAPADLQAGESAQRLVIRSDPADKLDVAAFSAAHPDFPTNRQLAMSVPLATPQLAEQHGLLNGADRQTWEVARRAITTRRAAGDDGLPDPASEGVVVHLLAGPGGLSRPLTDSRPWSGRWPAPEGKRLRLDELTVSGGAPAALSWSDDESVARIALAPAAEVTIELSSFLRTGMLDEFEVRRWLESFSPSAATAGRHPMVTPPATVRLVHAVRKPLQPPTGRLLARNPTVGDTFRTLDAEVELETASTAQVDVTASWSQWHDDPVAAEPTRVDIADAPVQEIVVDRGPVDLPPIRHELGDTRHRLITYTLTAVSRFRDCFPPVAEGASLEPFLHRNTLPAVGVLSSARPPAPVVTAVTPAFRWERDEPTPGWTRLVHRRLGGRVRVHLARPWFVTGDDERLAVVVAGNAGPPAVELQPHVTWVARDPTLETAAPARWPTSAAFAGIADEGPQTIAIAEAAGQEATLVPYDVSFADGQWFADVDLAAAAAGSYAPFVQLALARAQPFSVAGAERSTIVGSDIVSLLPDRTLTVERTGRSITVTLSGLGPTGPLPPHLVEVVVEQAPAGVDPDLAAGGLTALDTVPPGVGAWTRVPDLFDNAVLGVTIPPLEMPAGVPLRLMVREVERLSQATDLTDVVEVNDRTVFIDHVHLPPFE